MRIYTLNHKVRYIFDNQISLKASSWYYLNYVSAKSEILLSELMSYQFFFVPLNLIREARGR